jgi:iron complex outermembrane receptor protein
VLEPRFAKGLTLTADYYHVDITRPISVLGEPNILASCYPSQEVAVPPQCDQLVTRDPATHFITNIENLPTNLGSEQMAGVDVGLQYAAHTPVGRVGLLFDGTWLQKYDRRAGSVLIRGKGTFDLGALGTILNPAGVGGVHPSFKFVLALTWKLGRFGAGVSTRYVGGFTECGTTNGVFSGGGLCYVDSTYRHRVEAYQTWDFFLSYAFVSPAGRTKIAAGVQNAFDRNPPVVYNALLGTDPTAYDLVGRFFYARLTHAL